jgi:hypothetical protein
MVIQAGGGASSARGCCLADGLVDLLYGMAIRRRGSGRRPRMMLGPGSLERKITTEYTEKHGKEEKTQKRDSKS